MKVAHLSCLVSWSAVVIVSQASADELHVPGDYATIQAAVDASRDGDEVIISDGVYAGVGNKDIDFKGRAITVRSAHGAAACTIDCESSGRAFTFHSGESRSSVVSGLTITGGFEMCEDGGAILIEGSGPTITQCVFVANGAQTCCFPCPTGTCCQGGRGGAIASISGSPNISDCQFLNNLSTGTTFYNVGGGGAVYVGDGAATIERCWFSGNNCTGRGGGMVIEYTGGEVIDCVFSANHAQNGGGLYLYETTTLVSDCHFVSNSASFSGGMYTALGSPVLERCTFTSNVAAIAGGLNSYGTAQLRDCEFSGNKAFSQDGGGISSAGDLSLLRCVFRDNSAQTDGGGMASARGVPSIVACKFVANSAVYHGGALFVGNDGTPNPPAGAEVQDTLFLGNLAGWGGAVSNYFEVTPRFVNVLFVANKALNPGGAVFSQWRSKPLFINTTFAQNEAGLQGGVILLNPLSEGRFENCVLWGNTCPVGHEVALSLAGYVSTAIFESSLLDGGPGEISTAPESIIEWGPDSIDSSPAFVRLANPGSDGVWGTADDDEGDFRLGPGSPCVDAGNNSLVPAQVTTDITGLPRFIDDPSAPDSGIGRSPLVDMGAYERQIGGAFDLIGDGHVNGLDLALLLGQWGRCAIPPAACPADLDHNGVVNGLDLAMLLAAWTA